ncbi:G2 and S phase-expressed protein 1 isoform X3 [Rhinoderma darwinii]|uniref:G2 and S phase-expressed protein 1 isoform X3 n=1 Tax=Rhinoderma darwinii TaxID=43563 RepID=UPI003F660CA4
MAAGGDISLLTDEKFDFDISISPTSAKDNVDCDDEVFIGPMRHKEKCVSAALRSLKSDEKSSPPLKTDQVAWSPLNDDKFVEIFKEAHLLALQLECFSNDDHKKEEPAQPVPNQTVEKFVQESKSKVILFDACNEVTKTPVAIKRETYCIQDSPFHQLPPSVQQRLTGPNRKAGNSCGVESQNLASPLKVLKLVKSHSSSPLAQKSKPLVKSGFPMANSGKTVSKLQPMKAPAVNTKNNRLAVEKPKAVKKTSPTRRKNLSSMGSTEDLLSDKSSIASDISDSSFNTSVVGPSKRTLPVPNKLGLSIAQFKPRSATSAFRKNTSSSSSSHSSMNTSLNSSLSSSPPAVHAKPNASVPSSRLKPNTNWLAVARPLSGIGLSSKNTTDLLNSHLKPGTAAKPADDKSASVSVVKPQTPAGKMQKQTSAPNLQRLPPPTKMEIVVKGENAKPQARVMPTPTNRLKLPQKQEGLSPDRAVGMSSKPTRLLSCGEIGRFAECEQKETKVAKSTCSPTEEDHLVSTTICCSLNFSPESKPVLMAHREEKQWVADKPSEVLLIDIGVDKAVTKVRKHSSIDVESPALIDLSNTPEFTKKLIPLKAVDVGQLIDLSSPLVKRSPAGNKENLEYVSPLLKF